MNEYSVREKRHIYLWFAGAVIPVKKLGENREKAFYVKEGGLDHRAVTGKTYTFAEVVRDTRRFARALRSLGLRKGHVVIVAFQMLPEYGIVAPGIMASGGVFSGAQPAAHESEFKKQVEAAGANLSVTNDINYGKVTSKSYA
ncbi:LONG-CHAIN-FATTY-ACID--COA LIGASE [Salix koriyanagi]|uniref:LONG-CHAIN-FATTY-ACID--COA LIGASE n=1 Tax=Salix koriyanagi TaxID=2511006 RepID=A0A9Q0PV46_9ROSI|nr:LONG-CHAIN-FATTY-ACID--COA LIGASE [Salix koriyanagi]